MWLNVSSDFKRKTAGEVKLPTISENLSPSDNWKSNTEFNLYRKTHIIKIYNIETQICFNDSKKETKFKNKWHIAERLLRWMKFTARGAREGVESGEVVK